MTPADEQTPPDGFNLDAEARTPGGGIVGREPADETDHPDPVDADGSAHDDDAIDVQDAGAVPEDV